MYNPAGIGAASDNLEWIELHNQMAVDMDLSGWRLDNGIDFKIPEGIILKAGKDLVIASNPTALQAASGFTGALGPFHLSPVQLRREDRAEGEERPGCRLGDLRHKRRLPVAPDGSGVSLAKINPDTAGDTPSNWANSGKVGGTPGATNFQRLPTPSPRSTRSPPAPPASSSSPIPPTPRRRSVASSSTPRSDAGSVRPPRDDAPRPQLPVRSRPRSSASPRHARQAIPLHRGRRLRRRRRLRSDVLKGRSPDGAGRWLVPSAPTPGAANTFQFHDEIVINEIMYHDTPVAGQPANVVQNTAIDYRDNHWKYEQSGTDLGAGWSASNFDDSAWTTGQGVFYGGNVPGVVGAPPRPSPSRAFSAPRSTPPANSVSAAPSTRTGSLRPPAAPRRSPRSS